MAKRLSATERFFYDHAGYSYSPMTQTINQGRRECAAALANAEAYAESMDWAYSWEPDPEPWDGDADAPSELFGCILRDSNGRVLGSLWSIGDPTTQYMRVVQAELALEAMPDFMATGAEIA